MQIRTSQVLIPVVGAGLLVFGLIALGKAARDRLRQHERYTLAVGDIDCPAPPGMRRPDFLAEVQYVGHLPDRLPALDDDTPVRLTAAFAGHPWVETVAEVRLLPPDGARVRLTFRTPVLAVSQPAGSRVVDGKGVLLPASARADGLPTLHGDVAPPAALAGAAWGDPSVAAAAAVAGLLRTHAERLELTTCEVHDGRVELVCGRARVVWGGAPGSEKEGESPAAEKLRRLLEVSSRPGGLDAYDSAALDLRQPTGG
jgi:hypothetical protein